ncbi:hypothetical protein [Luteimonas sp. R10]|uniref:hypothetical protein n=1 Tax=Luteimonas sp. R10 TaxID=3108176 RepID=UPI003088C71D|nr:hypothetical protein U3649_14470 [Luteimonas sp. R10]
MSGPHSAALASQCVDIGAGLAAALADLARDPEPSRCEMMAIRLDGARRHCQLLGEAVRKERADGVGG